MTIESDSCRVRPGMHRRAGRVRVAALTVLALSVLATSVVACGDGEEAEVRETVELFLTSGAPRSCGVQTARFLRNRQDERDLDAATRACRKDDSPDPAG